MNSCNRNVRRIHDRLGRNYTCLCKSLGQLHSIRGGIKDRDCFEGREPPARTARITACGLLDNQRRYVEVELWAPHTPPSTRELLVRALNEVPARTCCEITHYRRFDVHAGRHQAILRPSNTRV